MAPQQPAAPKDDEDGSGGATALRVISAEASTRKYAATALHASATAEASVARAVDVTLRRVRTRADAEQMHAAWTTARERLEYAAARAEAAAEAASNAATAFAGHPYARAIALLPLPKMDLASPPRSPPEGRDKDYGGAAAE